jgi:hypothetical protein
MIYTQTKIIYPLKVTSIRPTNTHKQGSRVCTHNMRVAQSWHFLLEKPSFPYCSFPFDKTKNANKFLHTRFARLFRALHTNDMPTLSTQGMSRRPPTSASSAWHPAVHQFWQHITVIKCARLVSENMRL